ncbi:MAG TPA: DUF1223 domain-containing protein [Candidatus Binataceae bacterium]
MELHASKSRWNGLAAGCGLLLAFMLGALLLDGEAASAQSAKADEDAPVVLELFTSEGCSSCPPADELLSRIGALTPGVIPLAYHVDYWNSLGWSDPLSSNQWTMRQVEYVRAMQLRGSYTPQIVVNGRWQCIGSNPNGITRLIAAARATPPPAVVTVRAMPLAADSRKLNLSVSAHIVRSAGDKSLIVLVAIYENGLTASIDSGENSGHRIKYDYTVRKIIPAFELSPTAGSALENELSVNLDPSWRLDHLGVAAFIQDETSLAIDGGATQYPLGKPASQ